MLTMAVRADRGILHSGGRGQAVNAAFEQVRDLGVTGAASFGHV